jgi:hypothetical protein
MGFDAVSGFVVGFLRVLGSTVVGKDSTVLVGGEGQVGALTDDDEDTPGEAQLDVEMYSGLGLVVRPRPPETVDGRVMAAEAMALRVGGVLTPVGWRDPRLNRKFPAPGPGSVALVGYGGGFLAFDDTDDLESKATWYVPYAHSNGVPTKAMVIAVDPDGESLMLVHGDGYAVVLDKDNGITMRSKTGASWVNLADDKFEVVATSISLRGNVALGADTSSAVPLLPGSSSQPTPSVFFSPV